MSGTKKAPGNAVDAIYERVIEVQEQLAEVAKDQAANDVKRDQIIDLMSRTLARLTEMFESRAPTFTAIHEGVEEIPSIAAATRTELSLKFETAIEKAIEKLGKMFAARQKRLILSLFLATFLGSFLGATARERIIELLIHLVRGG